MEEISLCFFEEKEKAAMYLLYVETSLSSCGIASSSDEKATEVFAFVMDGIVQMNQVIMEII